MAEPSKIPSNYRANDIKLRDDIMRLVLKHSKKQNKILSSIRFKVTSTPDQSFDIDAVTMYWKFPKQKKK